MSTQATTFQEYRRFERWNACARTSSFRDSVIASLMPLGYRSVEGLVDHGPSLDSLRRYQWSSSNTSSDQDSGKQLPIYFLAPDFVDKYSSIGDPVNLQSSKPSHLCLSWHVCVRSWALIDVCWWKEAKTNRGSLPCKLTNTENRRGCGASTLHKWNIKERAPREENALMGAMFPT